jgi:hypothetical protein
MRMPLRTFLSAALVAFSCSYTIPASSKEEECRDLLSSLHRKPDYIRFLNCRKRIDLQGSPFEATYRVEGSHAAQAEQYLIKIFKIKTLSRTCCVWESANNSYRDARGRSFVISMSTEETTVDKRKQWPAIQYFYITVDLFVDEP